MAKLPVGIRRRLLDFACDVSEPAEFEAWVYTTPELEEALGPESYLEMISANYSTNEGVFEARRKAAALLELDETGAVARHQAEVARYQAETLATRMLSGEISLLTGLRKLASLHNNGYDFIPVIFVGLASETDCVPEEGQYQQWEPLALAQQLAKLEFYKPRIIAELESFLADTRRQRDVAH